MSREKQYSEEEVIGKAMNLFWRDGVIPTSMNALEKEMGINKFSIYASFGDKQGLFLESMKCYCKKITQELLDPLKEPDNGLTDIKTYFLNFIEFSKEKGRQKGCFMTNTVTEFGDKIDGLIRKEILRNAANVNEFLKQKLRQASNNSPNEVEVNRKANYLMATLQGLSAASQMMDSEQVLDFVDITFENIA